MRVSSFLLPVLVALAASGAAAQSVTPDCAAKLIKQAGMYPGTQGSYYYMDELSGQWMGQPWTQTLKAAPSFGQVAAALKARGTTLVLAPVPARSILPGAALDPQVPAEAAFDVAGGRAFYHALVRELNAAGVPAADLLDTALAQNSFPKDIHWLPRGARLAADAVATLVKRQPVYAALPRQDFVTLDVGDAVRLTVNQPVIAKAKDLCGETLAPDSFQSDVTVPDTDLPAAAGNFGDSENGKQRWAYGPSAAVSFFLKAAGPVTITLKAYNLIEGQQVDLSVNGAATDSLKNLAKGAQISKTYTVNAVAGANRLDFRVAAWNGHNSAFAPGDIRPLGLPITTLTVSDGKNTADLIALPSDSSGLLGPAEHPVVLVGASYSLPVLNFDGALRDRLKTDLLNVAYGAAGVFNSLKDYLRDPQFQANPPKLLIWEFPVLGGDSTTDADFRDVLAAVQGPCAPAQALKGAGSAGGMDVPASAVQAGARVHVTADDKSVQSVTLTAGTQAPVTLVNSSRMVHQGEFYSTLSAPAGTPLHLAWPTSTTGTVQVEVCAGR
ncbi:hypothetical protein MF271_20725 (plasmid) [Deinococcus sp. KNUC1210]|uniref:alginate O-acetyltransferase AlgX-related protein n=1 Tax=Deinococcus sp. KNUC1210 TaxID=2917691 RepID=UPI001EEFE988|nr:hypothetical protein [Deinococcus sp. KNUC1210]ULH17484.1 hypothetical protein MF271_20725 [Deinococcus sp. KNUC1210]